jgi:hypothetical protein
MSSLSRMRTALQSFERRGGEGSVFAVRAGRKQIFRSARNDGGGRVSSLLVAEAQVTLSMTGTLFPQPAKHLSLDVDLSARSGPSTCDNSFTLKPGNDLLVWT